MSTFLLNDSAPATIAQAFEAPAAPSTEVYWGGLASMQFDAGGTPPVSTSYRMCMGIGFSLVVCLL